MSNLYSCQKLYFLLLGFTKLKTYEIINYRVALDTGNICEFIKFARAVDAISLNSWDVTGKAS